MADSKISALTTLLQADVVPSSNVLPIVNASTTKKITVNALVNAQLAQSTTTTGIGVTSPVLRFAVERDNGSGYVGSFRNAAGSPYITVQTTGGLTQLQGINAAFTDVSDIGLQPSGGNVKLGGNITQAVAAKGVNFTANTPAAGMTSQLLNWYEEGTWTPAFTFNTPGDFALGAPIVQQGRYTKVGRQVTCNFAIVTTPTWTTASSYLIITGLPFTVANVGGPGFGPISFTNVTKANYTSYTIEAEANGTRAFLTGSSNSGLPGYSIQAVDMGSGVQTVLAGSITYTV